jgi:hypothetical protein
MVIRWYVKSLFVYPAVFLLSQLLTLHLSLFLDSCSGVIIQSLSLIAHITIKNRSLTNTLAMDMTPNEELWVEYLFAYLTLKMKKKFWLMYYISYLISIIESFSSCTLKYTRPYSVYEFVFKGPIFRIPMSAWPFAKEFSLLLFLQLCFSFKDSHEQCWVGDIFLGWWNVLKHVVELVIAETMLRCRIACQDKDHVTQIGYVRLLCYVSVILPRKVQV